MSISYTSASTGSRDNAKVRLMQQPFQVSREQMRLKHCFVFYLILNGLNGKRSKIYKNRPKTNEILQKLT